MKVFSFIIIAALGSLLLAGEAQATQQQKKWQRGELLASEDFSGDLSRWMAEGSVDACVVDGRLRFESTEKTESKKGNIWWRQRFSGPVLIEFDYQSVTEHGLSMFWFNAHGRGGADLLSIERDGRYEDYVKGPINGYHFSFHRFGSGVSNLRKSHGFHKIASSPDPVPATDLEKHKVQVYCNQGHIRVLFDGRVVHDMVDEGKPCTEGGEWVHEVPCQGTGEPYLGGYVGIRHTQNQAAFYDNFRVYRLLKP